jgi:dolichol-phosphate mannosyltransferase
MSNKKQTAVVVIPTYNEVDSIGKMIDHLFSKTFPTVNNWHCKLLVVDDTSPDGTYKVVQDKQKKYQDLYLLLNKEKAGIGNAYVKGFKEAMKNLGADVIIEFDSDFQHPPETIPVMLKEIENGADYVLGSRKIKGGSNPKGWGFKRIFFSEVGGFMARFILFFPFKNFFKITDPTTGLKASRVKGFVDKIDMDHLYSKSFAYKMEFLFKMVLLKAKIKEIPLQFGLRTAGDSKISGQTASDILKTVIQLRLKDDPFVKKFLKFGTVGFIGYIVNAIFLNVFSKLGWLEFFVWVASTELAIISNFTLNNIWTFKTDKIKGLSGLTKKFLQFNFTSAGALLIQSATGAAGVYFFSLNRQLLLPFIIVFLVLPYNWFMYNKIIWKKK